MPSYVSAEPTVVDDDLLHKAVKDEETQRSSHKATQSDFDIPLDVLNRGRTDPSEVTTLRLDFKSRPWDNRHCLCPGVRGCASLR